MAVRRARVAPQRRLEDLRRGRGSPACSRSVGRAHRVRRRAPTRVPLRTLSVPPSSTRAAHARKPRCSRLAATRSAPRRRAPARASARPRASSPPMTASSSARPPCSGGERLARGAAEVARALEELARERRVTELARELRRLDDALLRATSSATRGSTTGVYRTRARSPLTGPRPLLRAPSGGTGAASARARRRRPAPRAARASRARRAPWRPRRSASRGPRGSRARGSPPGAARVDPEVAAVAHVDVNEAARRVDAHAHEAHAPREGRHVLVRRAGHHDVRRAALAVVRAASAARRPVARTPRGSPARGSASAVGRARRRGAAPPGACCPSDGSRRSSATRSRSCAAKPPASDAAGSGHALVRCERGEHEERAPLRVRVRRGVALRRCHVRTYVA